MRGVTGAVMEDECGCCLAECQCGDCLICTEAPIRIPFADLLESGHYRRA